MFVEADHLGCGFVALIAKCAKVWLWTRQVQVRDRSALETYDGSVWVLAADRESLVACHAVGGTSETWRVSLCVQQTARSVLGLCLSLASKG